MPVKEVVCSSILRQFTRKDHLFKGKYAVDVYQNCAFGCRYCDSANDSLIYVCINALDLLSEILDHMPAGRVIIGSVYDSYQSVEQHFTITRGVVKILIDHGFPVHILTKSLLVLRDSDMLKQSNLNMVTMSICSMNKSVVGSFESGVPSPRQRLACIQKLRKSGVSAGVAVFPIIPYLTDKELPTIIHMAKRFDAEYVVCKHLELKGQQKKDFIALLAHQFPEIVEDFKRLYNDQYAPNMKYIHALQEEVKTICEEEGLNYGIQDTS